MIPAAVFGGLAALTLPVAPLGARPYIPPTPSFGFFTDDERLSALNQVIHLEGHMGAAPVQPQWEHFVFALSREIGPAPFVEPLPLPEGEHFATGMINRLAGGESDQGQAEPAASLLKRVVEAHEQTPSRPLMLWAGMLRDGMGVPKNPQAAMDEFLRVAGTDEDTAEARKSKAFALREAVITRLLYPAKTADALALRSAVAEAALHGVEHAYYWQALLQRYERVTDQVDESSYGNVDGIFDGIAAGDLWCSAVGDNRARLAGAVAAGVPAALYNLGLIEETGSEGPVNNAEAVRLYRLAAEKEMPNALVRLALMLADGRGKPGTDDEPLWLLRRTDDPIAATLLGSVLCSGEWGEKDFNRGQELLGEAVAAGWWRAGFQRAWFYQFAADTAPQPERAKECVFDALMHSGIDFDEAKIAVGWAYWNGVIVPRDREEAFGNFYTVSDRKKPPLVLVRVARVLRTGAAGMVKLDEAQRSAEKALEQGEIEAELEMAEIELLRNRPVDALQSLHRAADAGLPAAFARLADLAAQGIGGPVDLALAGRLRAQAAALAKREDGL